MAYTINLTNGNVFAVIPDGTVNTNSSMVLVGKNYAGYGEFLDENFIHLLENASNSTAPSAPLVGQLWWDSTNLLMKVYNGSTWKTISAAAAAASAPVGNVTGDLWFDTVNSQLNVWTGTAWLVVGPAYTATEGKSGAFSLTISDGTSDHVVTAVYVANTIVSISSADTSFNPVAPYNTDFPTIFRGTTVYAPGSTGGNISNAGNVYVTSNGNATLNVTDTSIQVTGNVVTSAVTNSAGDISMVFADVGAGNIYLNQGEVSLSIGEGIVPGLYGVYTTGYMSADGGMSTPGNVSVGQYLSATGNIFGGNLRTTGSVLTSAIEKAGSNGVGNIGSSSSYFNYVFATATTALYADVAERFAADEVLDAGTVVELGGSAEITKSRQDLSDKVFGVISTRAAYLMNGGAGTDETHPPVAMTGRVPVRVVGQVSKGDRLVSAGDGIARAAQPGEATAFNTIGRALADKNTAEEGLVEAIVTIK